jgi:hypothetical protein
MTDLRCYTFTIFPLSSIQQGIQAGHAAVELFNKYEKIDLVDWARATGDNPPPHVAAQANAGKMLYDWSKDHKTMVCLNGGDVMGLRKIIALLCEDENPYPWAPFTESMDFLASLTTSVAIILPQEFYETASWIRANPDLTIRKPWSTHQYNYDPVACLHQFTYHWPKIPAGEELQPLEFTDWQVALMELMNRCPLAR